MKKIVLLVIATIFIMGSVAYAKSVPRAVRKDIEVLAELKYPTDLEMRKYTIKNQCDSWVAVYRLKRVPEIKRCILEEIKDRAQNKWGNDYEMQMHEIMKQCNAYREIKHFKAVRKIPKATVNLQLKKIAENKWPHNYVMQLEKLKDLCQEYDPTRPPPSGLEVWAK